MQASPSHINSSSSARTHDQKCISPTFPQKKSFLCLTCVHQNQRSLLEETWQCEPSSYWIWGIQTLAPTEVLLNALGDRGQPSESWSHLPRSTGGRVLPRHTARQALGSFSNATWAQSLRVTRGMSMRQTTYWTTCPTACPAVNTRFISHVWTAHWFDQGLHVSCGYACSKKYNDCMRQVARQLRTHRCIVWSRLWAEQIPAVGTFKDWINCCGGVYHMKGNAENKEWEVQNHSCLLWSTYGTLFSLAWKIKLVTASVQAIPNNCRLAKHSFTLIPRINTQILRPSFRYLFPKHKNHWLPLTYMWHLPSDTVSPDR